MILLGVNVLTWHASPRPGWVRREGVISPPPPSACYSISQSSQTGEMGSLAPIGIISHLLGALFSINKLYVLLSVDR